MSSNVNKKLHANIDVANDSQSFVLNVERSVLNKKWVSVPTDERMAQGISQAYGVPEIVGSLLVARGINFDNVEEFLNPSIKNQLPNPSVLQDMDKAAARIADAIMNGEKVAVFGDYDVDGATSSALLKKFFAALGHELRIYIPDRIDEGYGPNAPAFLELKNEGADLVITVDCGTTAFEAIDAGTKAGLDIVVVDHHRTEVKMPNAHAVVNPNRMDDESGQGHMAAVGVVFLTVVAINRVLRERGFYKGKIAEPKILQWLDLVALGTVCDVVSLTGVNRAFVAQGLKMMSMRQNKGLSALADIADVDGTPNTFHAGFLLGPRVNAGGRVGNASLGANLLSSDCPIKTREIASKLNQYNHERRELEKTVLEQAIEMVEASANKDSWAIIVAGEGWHPGVVGIVASRLKDKYNKPACVISFDDDGIGKASARSVSGVDLGSTIISAKQNELLVAGGGHKMAAGFTVTRGLLEDFTAYVNQHIKDQLNGERLVPELKIDNVLSLHSLNTDLVEKIDMLAPYGAGHAEPRLALTGVKIIKPRVVGENHVSFFIQDSSGGASIKGIAFRALDNDLGDLLLTSGTAMVDLAGYVKINEWLGKRSVNFQVVDAANPWDK